MIKDGKNGLMQKETKRARYALFVGVILMIFLPIILTQKFGIISFMDTGPIGDTIGGITAPISGLLGAYLVFLALKAQVEANRIVMDEIEKQAKVEGRNRNSVFLQEIVKQINIELNSFEYKYRQGAFINTKSNIDGFIDYVIEFEGNFELEAYNTGVYSMEKYKKILKLCQYFVNKLSNSGFQQDDIEYHTFVFRSEFYEKIETNLKTHLEESMNFAIDIDDPSLILTRNVLELGEDLDRLNA